MAAFAGSLAMAQLLVDSTIPLSNIMHETLVQSIKGENVEVLSWAASKFRVGYYDARLVH